LRVGIVGELSEVKNQADFLRAAAPLADEFGASVEFVIAGDEAARAGEYRARLEKLISELRLTRSVRLVRRCEDVAPIIASLDVLVSASRTESFGMVLAEAAACGVPAVAVSAPGCEEVVRDGETGVLTKSDPMALGDAVIGLLLDAERRVAMGRRARRLAERLFDVRLMIERTLAVYAAATARAGRAGR
jgi:glycosyltransferase involved in cell wall biosynthesis